MPTEIEKAREAMQQAQTFGRGQYIEEGKHVLEISLAKAQPKSMGGGNSFIVEMTVLESTKYKPGATVSYVETIEKAGALGRIKAFLYAVVGVDPADNNACAAVDDQVVTIYTAIRFEEARKSSGLPENFLKGRRVQCEGFAGKSKSGGPVTNKKWLPLPEQSAA